MKEFKWLLIAFIIVYTGVSVVDMFNKKPFKFEDFKKIEEAQTFFDTNYPINSSYLKLLADLKTARSICETTSLTEQEKEYKMIVRCVYNSGWISLQPLVDYIIVIYVSHKDEIKKIKFNKGYVGP